MWTVMILLRQHWNAVEALLRVTYPSHLVYTGHPLWSQLYSKFLLRLNSLFANNGSPGP